jgi:hypothetical protein
MSTEAESALERGLRRELRFWEAIALSIGIMAPGAAMALNGTLPASLVGRSRWRSSSPPWASCSSPTPSSDSRATSIMSGPSMPSRG